MNDAAATGSVKVNVIGDATVNHGNTDSSSIQPILLGGDVRFHGGSKALIAVVLKSDFAIRRDIGDVSIFFQLGKSRDRNIKSRSLNAMQSSLHPSTTSCHSLIMLGGRSDLELHDHIHPFGGMAAVNVAGNLPVLRAGALVEELRRRYRKARRCEDDGNC